MEYKDKCDEIELKTRVMNRLKNGKYLKWLKKAKDLYDDVEPSSLKDSILDGNGGGTSPQSDLVAS